MTDWKPIETAPKDKAILVCCDSGAVFAVRWGPLADDEWVILGGSDMDYRDQQGRLMRKRVPTHWMPLPDPPKP